MKIWLPALPLLCVACITPRAPLPPPTSVGEPPPEAAQAPVSPEAPAPVEPAPIPPAPTLTQGLHALAEGDHTVHDGLRVRVALEKSLVMSGKQTKASAGATVVSVELNIEGETLRLDYEAGERLRMEWLQQGAVHVLEGVDAPNGALAARVRWKPAGRGARMLTEDEVLRLVEQRAHERGCAKAEFGSVSQEESPPGVATHKVFSDKGEVVCSLTLGVYSGEVISFQARGK